MPLIPHTNTIGHKTRMHTDDTNFVKLMDRIINHTAIVKIIASTIFTFGMP